MDNGTMLEAGDIILITVGVALILVTIVASCCALMYTRRKQTEQRIAAAELRHKTAMEFYVDEPTIHGVPKRERPRIPINIDALEKSIDMDYGRRDTEVSTADETAEIVRRPKKFIIHKTEEKAEKAEAIQTEHLLSEFIDDYKRMKQAGVTEDEFEILEQRDLHRYRSCSVAESHSKKNRFADILPYDDTRVILNDGTYINASNIETAGECSFIATQGPIGRDEVSEIRKEATIDDFWNMVWQTQSECIVMLTDLTENLRTKCSQYWPSDLGSSCHFGSVKVALVSESRDPTCEIREFEISKGGTDSRKVRQYHLRDWQDSSTPANLSQLLDFVERVSMKIYVTPVIVHCSAGIGRTGVFIAIWRLLDRARKEGLINVFNVVDFMRSQRRRMVQNNDQYASIYSALACAIKENRL